MKSFKKYYFDEEKKLFVMSGDFTQSMLRFSNFQLSQIPNLDWNIFTFAITSYSPENFTINKNFIK